MISQSFIGWALSRRSCRDSSRDATSSTSSLEAPSPLVFNRGHPNPHHILMKVLSSHAIINTPPAFAAVIPQQPVQQQQQQQQQPMQETKYLAKLAEVRSELEPLGNELIEHRGKLDVACAESKPLKEKHNAGPTAYEDVQCQTDDLVEKIEQKTAYKAEIQTEVEEKKPDASEAREVEQECRKKQESLAPLEQPTRQNVFEITNGRLGDLGAIDGFREFRIVRDNIDILQGVKGLPVAGPPGFTCQYTQEKPLLPEGSHTTVSGPAQKVQREVKNSSNAHAATTSTNSVIGVYLSSSDPVHVPSPHSYTSGTAGAIRREVGVVGVQSLFFISADFDTGFSCKRLLLDSCNFCRKSLDQKRDIFMYRGDTPFCSEECRLDEIEIDEAMEKNHRLSSLLRQKIVTLASVYWRIPATSHYKPVPAVTSVGYGNFTYPAGFIINAPASTGADIWIQTPREAQGLQSAHPTFMPTHMLAQAGLGSLNASAQSSHVQDPGLYHPTQLGSIPNTHYMVHQQVAPGFGQGVGVGVAGPGPQVGTYQQPQATRIDEEHANLEEQMKSLRQKISDAMRRWLCQKISDAMRRYQATEKVEAHLEMKLAKCEEEIDSMNAQHNYLEKQLDSLKNDELSKLNELHSTISSEQKELDRLTKCSSKLREKDTEIKRHKLKMATGQRMLKRLTSGIEELKKEKEKLVAEEEEIISAFINVRREALTVQEQYMNTEEIIDAAKDVRDKTKADKLKKTLDELRICETYVEYKLHYLKHLTRRWECQMHAHKQRVADLQLDMVLVHPYYTMMDIMMY